ncbi:MAG: thioesterase family protein [Proteobacteria bacterium]|nr:thioesterase family protein [Pseudomonadota bacterium]MDA0993240.1 thioesterase family protein [Pseudomonadota bacterium]
MRTGSLLGTIVHEGSVLAEWIDSNDHMNVAFYILAFDHGVDSLWEKFGITNEYMKKSRGSTFAVESHVIYRSELLEGDPYIVTSQILGFDEKRIHQFMRLYHADSRSLAATAEWMNLHVSLDSRRVSPWANEILARIREFSERQTDQVWPPEAGRQMRIANPLFSVSSE